MEHMEEKQLLEAIRKIIQEELQPITERLDNLQEDLMTMKETLAGEKEISQEMKESQDYLIEWIDRFDHRIKRLSEE